MGKRTNFKRRERDFYPTPYEAVVPLLPFIDPSDTFAEPCAGDGVLVDHLKKNGIECRGMSDIDPRNPDVDAIDVFDLTACSGDMFITNPPWDWDVLSKLIPHLSSLAYTWLLLNADLMHNKRMGGFMNQCEAVVSVGRVSWMGNGKKGFENCAWYCFNDRHVEFTEFYSRAA